MTSWRRGLEDDERCMNQVERDNREGVRESDDKERRKMEAAQRMEGGIYGHSESGKAQSHTPCPINGGPLKLSLPHKNCSRWYRHVRARGIAQFRSSPLLLRHDDHSHRCVTFSCVFFPSWTAFGRANSFGFYLSGRLLCATLSVGTSFLRFSQ